MIIKKRLSQAAAVALFCSALAACSVFDPCGSARCAEDSRMTNAVQDEINARAALKVDDISVQTVDGVVYLNGLVDTEYERREATSVALAVPGVGQVVNKLGVRGNFW